MVRFSKYSNQPHRVRANYINGEQVDWINIPNKGWVAVGNSSGNIYNWDDNTGKIYHVSPTTYDIQQIVNSNRNYSKPAFNKRYANVIKQAKARSWKPEVTQSKTQTTDSGTSDNPVNPNNDTSDTGDTGGGNPRGGNHPKGTGGGSTQTSTQKYNYKFGQYYTADPNDSSKSIANDYFNADKYSNRIDAFKAARDAGHGVFTWRGKAYNTMDKGDDPLEFRRKHSDYDAFIGRAHMKNGDDGIDNSGGWSGSKNYNRDNVFNNQQINPITADQANNNTLVSYNQQSQTPKTPKTPQRTRLQKFTDDDIRSLGFNNYQGLLNAANNSNNKNNRFLQSMYDRYGSDTSKWNQTTIENDLGVKGKYRRFGGGDFGDMSRSMMAWVGKNNGEIDRQGRTGSNGTVYSSKEMRDAFERHTPNKQQSFQIPTTSTKSTTQNQNNNTFSGDYSNPYSNFGYALHNYNQVEKKQKGGTINMEEQQLQQAFLQYLMQQTGAKDQQQLEQVIQQLGEEGLKQAYSQFLQEMQQQQVQAAKFGAKLNYIRRLNGQCPDGTEMTYFKVGGKLCKKCIQRQQRENEAEEPSDPIKAFKCGRKMKRK